MPNFGEKLKQLRNYNGYTQEDLASMVIGLQTLLLLKIGLML